MAITPVVKPQYPNVPQTDGVPPLPRPPAYTQVLDIVTTLADIAETFIGGVVRYGIFDSDLNPILLGDTVQSFEFKQDINLPSYPQEEGAWANYNKVLLPYDVRVVLSFAGNATQRGAALSTATQILNTTELFTVVTPEFAYTSVNCNHMDFKRTAVNGANLLAVEMRFEKIRIPIANQTANNGQNPASADPVSAGVVQTAPITPVETSALPDPVSGDPNMGATQYDSFGTWLGPTGGSSS